MLAALAATALALLAAVLLFTVSTGPGWWAGVGVTLVAFGVFGGARGPTGVGVGVVAIASLVATRSEALWLTLGVSALMAALLIMILLVADLSFAMRRGTTVMAPTMQGLCAVHAIAVVLGVGLACLLIAGVLAIAWPGWLLLLPAIALGAASIAMVRQASRYKRKLRPPPLAPGMRPMPPPPPTGIRSTMPPPPAAGARPTSQIPPPPPG